MQPSSWDQLERERMSERSVICSSAPGSLRALRVSVLLVSLLLSVLPPTGAEEGVAGGRREGRQKRSPPYWGLWSSDFYGWLEELRARADHEGMRDLARTFWAHFPVSNGLGYDSPESDPQPEE